MATGARLPPKLDHVVHVSHVSTVFQVTRLAVQGTAAVLPAEGRKDWIYSRDIAEAIIALVDAPTLPNTVYHWDQVSNGRFWIGAPNWPKRSQALAIG